MAGEDPDDPGLISNFPNQHEDGAEINDNDEPDFQAVIQSLGEEGAGGYAGTEGREDWALERECEIARLEKENEELRRLLEIDPSSLETKGIKVDEESISRLGSPLVLRTRRSSISAPGSIVGGMGGGTGGNSNLGMGMPGESYGQRLGNSAFMIGDGMVNGNGHQQQLGGNNALQRGMEIQPAMRLQQRRPPMFPRGGGNIRGGNPGSNLWSQPPLMSERPWQPSVGSNLDLIR